MEILFSLLSSIPAILYIVFYGIICYKVGQMTNGNPALITVISFFFTPIVGLLWIIAENIKKDNNINIV